MTVTDSATRSTEDGIPWRSPALVAILASTLMTPMDVPLISAALPEIGTFFEISDARAGLFITVYALPGMVAAPAIGVLADRFGRRDVLVACLVVFGLTGSAIGFTSDFGLAVGLRALQGVAAGSMLAALAMTMVGDRYRGRRHDAVMGVTSAMLSLGAAIYPMVGGALAADSWNAPFLLYTLTLPVAGFVLLAFDGDGEGGGRSDRGYFRAVIHSVPTRRTLGLYALMFTSFTLLFGGLYTVLPFYLTERFGFTTTAIGLLTSGVLLVSGAVATQNGRLSGMATPRTLLAAGFGLYAVSLLGFGLARTPAVLVVAVLLFGVGSGLITPTLFAAISGLVPDEVRAGVMSLQTTTIGAGQAVGPAAVGIGGSLVGYSPTLLGGSALAALAALAVAGSTVGA